MSNDLAFITNEKNKKLKQRIVELIRTSKELRFLIGFFYFSGINELYEELKKTPDLQINVLVGMSVDKTLHGLIEYDDPDNGMTDRERVEKFFESLSKSINSDEFDTEEFYERVKYYLSLIKKDKLKIRKTLRPNHGKLYIFNIKDELNVLKKSVLIIGSSNLTRSGLSSQEEFNLEISDYGTEEANAHFEKLWEESVRITEVASYKERLIELVEKKTLIAEITPFEAFAFVLKNYLDAQGQQKINEGLKDLLQRKGYQPYQYQLDAVAQALSVINNPDTPNGIIVSDVVGLGKSVIASLIARSLGKRGIIICPPSLVGDDNKRSGWKKYKEDFELYDWEIRSNGRETLEKTLELVKDNGLYEVVIIDEVHRFRNQDTEAYELLSNICRNKIVILLSATPFNNSPADIFSLLKLFVVPGKSKISLDNDLASKFRFHNGTFKKLSNIRKNYRSSNKQKKDRAVADYESLFGEKEISLENVKERAKYLSGSIRQVIEPVLIRRNRIDLKKDPVYSKEVYALSEVKDPQELFFELTQKQSDFYDSVTKTYFGEDESRKFKGAIYRPFYYETGQEEFEEKDMEKNRQSLTQSNLFDFMRRLLVKRFESSFGAFKQSVENFYNITDKVQQFIKNSGEQFILDRNLMDSIYESDIDEIEEALKEYEQKLGEGKYPKSYKVYDVSKFELRDQFLADIESDKKMFKGLLDELEALKLVDHDPKFERLVPAIKEVMSAEHPVSEPERKIIIFTEYTDTAKYLEERLEASFPGKILSIASGLSNSKINEILENFDASFRNQKDDYQILLATDKISEGFNLNRAGAVINYDIPWNPTRVIQRVGRINRIGKKVFNELYIYNFFPTLKGAEYVRSREIAAEKMFLIHNTLGEDAKIFEQDEEPTAARLFQRIMENPENAEEESFQTKIRRTFAEVLEKHPEVLQRLKELPSRVKVAKGGSDYLLSVFIKKGIGFYVRATGGDGEITEPLFEELYPYIICEKNKPRMELSGSFWNNYYKIKEHKERPRRATGEVSLENRARNNLNTLLGSPPAGFEKHLAFSRALLEDIVEYKTLSEFTLRRIANLETNIPQEKHIEKIMSEFEKLKYELGDDYLEKLKAHLGAMQSEVIVAIENIKE
jgi:superfamily II DNA or RNA helicase/HKD family nuclease